jgi:hypothetical protein
VYAPFALVLMLASLAVAAWCFVPAARDRYLGRSQVLLVILLEAALLVQAGLATVRLAGGEHPVELATFIGYLLTSVLFLPAGLALARMEPTRWGSIITGVSCVVCAVLTLRLQQVWTPLQ